jgi:hypothetical protein
MYWRSLEILLLGLASKLGSHSLTKTVLVAISTISPKQPPAGPWQFMLSICIGDNVKCFGLVLLQNSIDQSCFGCYIYYFTEMATYWSIAIEDGGNL